MKTIIDQIHSDALEASLRYKRAETDLIEILQRAEGHQVYLQRGHSSLFQYVTAELGLSESVAYNLIAVARKSAEVPELKAEIKLGTITLSNARRIVPVLTTQNKDEWIKKAKEMSSRQLEREIVRIYPQSATQERASYVAADRVKLELGLSEQGIFRLRRAQDILSQKKRRAVTLEETLEALTNEFLEKHDPVEKAKRHRLRKSLGTWKKNRSVKVRKPVARQKPALREPISAEVLHQVNLRDQKRCAYPLGHGRTCNQTRWLEVHHKVPVSLGGKNTAENLITLCSAHHKFWHSKYDQLGIRVPSNSHQLLHSRAAEQKAS